MPPKRRRRRHYKTGVHISPKCSKPIEYRSGWELVVCKWLDINPEVEAYAYEAVIIPYKLNPNSSKVRKYFPDFFVKFKDGTKLIVEVKRDDRIRNAGVQKKAAAAEAWCASHGFVYQIWGKNHVIRLQSLTEQAKVS